MTRIAVISDTHDYVPAGLLARLTEADEIWHLGDVCDPDTFAEFARLDIPMQAVLGNNEWHNLWPTQLTLKRAGWRFHLVHIPPLRAPAGVEFVLHGHTHVPRDETDAGGVRWLNPGCINGPRQGSQAGFAWLTVLPERQPEWVREVL